MRDTDRIIQIIPTPMRATAVYLEDDGSEYREPVHLMGLTSGGDIHFLVCDDSGFVDCPEDASNFVKYEYEHEV